VPRLSGARHRIVVDRIEAGTYAMAAAITGGRILLRGAELELFGAAKDVLEECGCGSRRRRRGRGRARDGGLRAATPMTRPFPGFATISRPSSWR
jgi:UDP-N-acetylglucosamine 1-carboxyvinyltransferase